MKVLNAKVLMICDGDDDVMMMILMQNNPQRAMYPRQGTPEYEVSAATPPHDKHTSIIVNLDS